MQLRRDFLRAIEGGVMGLFLIQSIRFLYGTLYAHVSSADLVRRMVDVTHLIDQPGYIEPATVERELFAVGIALLVPLLAILLARTTWSLALAVALGAVGRSMALQVPDSAVLAAALVVGAGLLYAVLLIIRHPKHFPGMMLIGIAADMLIRATGNTLDPTWNPDYELAVLGQELTTDVAFLGITVFMLLLTGYIALLDLEVRRLLEDTDTHRQGILTGWGSLAFGGFLFIELTLLGLPNAVARWTDMEYAVAMPWLVLATLMPLIPMVRDQTRVFLGAFDGVWRGWIWALMLGLLVMLGNRFDGPMALLVLILAQFVAALTLWWMVKSRANDSTFANPTPILILISAIIYGVLSVGDYFTYDYAFVREFEAPFQGLANILRSFKDMGLQLFLFATLVVCMPMILERRAIPWQRGRSGENFFTLVLVTAVTLSGIQVANPPVRRAPANINCLRVASLNIHSGNTLLFEQNLQAVADLLAYNGADIVLLQEVDAGRMSSFGVDQAEWLGRELGMEVSFFAQNEALHGLAILSRIPIATVVGEKLTSTGPQAAIMHVELSLDDQPFHIYNVWMGFQTTDPNGVPYPFEQQDQTRQNIEIEQLIARNHANNFDQRIILGGTFNYDRDSPLYSFWDRETPFNDPFIGLPFERVRTVFLVDNTSAWFDYIWLMNTEPYGVVVATEQAVSDHRLVIAGINRTQDQQCR